MIEWICDESNQSVIRELRTLSGDDYKSSKKQLPGITPSGAFNKRSESGLIKHSGLIQFDVDSKDNPVNMDELKYKIQHNPFVAYLSYSTSGNGLWGLIPVKHPERHKSHFRAIQQAFRNAGVSIDPAPSNVASFRFRSYDPDPYFNHNADVFHYLIDKIPASSNGRDNRTKVEQLISKIQANRIDITEGYEKWLKIGFALAEEFGESGRIYFHQLSQWHSEYDTAECDEQFDNCLNSNGQGITIASFFGICKDFGVTLDTNHAYQKDRVLQGDTKSKVSAPYGMNPYTGEIFDERGYPADWDFHLN
nr:PriCT-2 domain-containing protein [Rhodohalobacter sp. SW132]